MATLWTALHVGNELVGVKLSSIGTIERPPIATRLLKNEGFTKIFSGNLTGYQTSITIGNGQSIPALLNVAGDRVFATVSENEPYAQTLMSNINR